MILINLLPHREEARKRRKERFQMSLVGAAVAGALIAGAIYMYYQHRIENQQYLNSILKNEIQGLEKKIKEIADIEAEIQALNDRQKAVEDLQADRNMPVHLLNELVRQLPDGTYITQVEQRERIVVLRGMAQSNERISELLRNLANNTPWLSKPELVEITANHVEVTPKDKRRVAAFNLRFQLMRSSEVQAAQQAKNADAKQGD